MKTLVIGKEGRELGRYHLNKSNLLIGRSPICDLVVRAPYIQPMHYWLEYVSAAIDENDASGFWMITSISESESAQDKSEFMGNFTGEGMVLDSGKVEFKGIQFELIEDHLQESDIKRGAIRRDFERNSGATGAESFGQRRNQILSVVYYRRDLDLIANIIYLTRTKGRKDTQIFSSIKHSFLRWNLNKTESAAAAHLWFSDKTNFSEVEIFDRDKKLEPRKLDRHYVFDVNLTSFLVVKTPLMEYLLRFVPYFEATVEKKSSLKDPIVLATLFVLVTLVSFVVLTKNVNTEDEPIEQPKRIATVLIKEEPPPPPVEPPTPAEPEPAPVAEKIVPPPEPIIEKKAEPTKDAGASMATAAKTINTNNQKPKAGLDNPAPVKNINTVGLLGKLKGKKSQNTVAAESILSQGVVTENTSGDTGFVVKQSAAGVVGSVTKVKNNALEEASTTLSNASAADSSATGPIAISEGKGKFLVGDGSSDGLGSSSSSKGEGLNANENFEVSGGLDKDAIRTAIIRERRALRNCYESALLTKSKLAGKLVLRFQITTNGNVSSTRIENSSLNTPQFESCIEGVIKSINFPKAANGKPTTVIYPFVFQGKK